MSQRSTKVLLVSSLVGLGGCSTNDNRCQARAALAQIDRAGACK